jgi:hypothetical protein
VLAVVSDIVFRSWHFWQAYGDCNMCYKSLVNCMAVVITVKFYGHSHTLYVMHVTMHNLANYIAQFEKKV